MIAGDPLQIEPAQLGWPNLFGITHRSMSGPRGKERRLALVMAQAIRINDLALSGQNLI